MRLIGLVILALSLVLAPPAADAQKAGKVYRVGLLTPASGRNPIDEVFERSLKELGYVEGQNLRWERRYVGGQAEKFAAAAGDLMRLNVDVIVAWSPAATVAVKNATTTIPVVFLAGGAAVEHGLVPGLPRPGGNLTGITFQANRTLAPKYFELLKELVPKLSHVVVLRVPAEDPADETENYQTAAQALNIRLRQIALHRPDDLKDALASIEKNRPQALLGAPSGLLYVFGRDIAAFAAKHRLPAVYGLREVAEAGGLMSLSPNILDIAVRGASYVDKILKGAKPADLHIEQPTKFELVINLKTAKALGLTIPQTLQARADQVIE
jgi:putative tryptophan/tyrosine transport system substrate-binding protein